jgi:hypothetical protein
MNRVAKTSIALGAAVLCSVSLAQAETRADISIRAVVAKDIVSNRSASDTFKWEASGAGAVSNHVHADADFGKASAFKWETRDTGGEIAGSGTTARSAGSSPYFQYDSVTQNSAIQQGFRWAIRSTAQQQGFRWAIRSTSRQQGFRWAIRNTAQQQGFRWAIRNTAEQQGFRWAIR